MKISIFLKYPIRLIIFSQFLCLTLFSASAQNNPIWLMQDYKSASSAKSLFYYNDIPVKEYNGLINLSLPISLAKVDDISLDFSLNYYSGGIKIAQDASWVGIGWDINIGSIHQDINDCDDYDSGIIIQQPDWNESPHPSNYYQKMNNYQMGILEPGWQDLVPILEPKAIYSYRIYSSYPISLFPGGVPWYASGTIGHGYYMPINGNRDNQPLASDVVYHGLYDSEPDICTANFFGHFLTFIKDPKTKKIKILNKGYEAGGYKITQVVNGFQIISPNGDTFLFALKGTTVTPVEGGIRPMSSNTWYLTKIITKLKKEINFSYTNHGEFNNSKSVVQLWRDVRPSETTTFIPREKRIVLDKIFFPHGEIQFLTSSRDDVLGGRKLDQIILKNNWNEIVKTTKFNYDYFVSQNSTSDTVLWKNTLEKRLKLTEIEINDQKFLFAYNIGDLPSKSSYAVDFFGNFNGALSNTTSVPNATRLVGNTLCGSCSTVPSNGTNNSSNIEYAKIGVLSKIIYPTGGYTTFDYELNEFDNYILPDYYSTSNTITHGNGLRVKELKYYENASHLTKKTVYEYSGGKQLLPIYNLYYNYQYQNFSGPNEPRSYPLVVNESSSKPFASNNSLSSGSIVGYEKVTKKDYSANGVLIGKIENFYSNEPDFASAPPSYYGQVPLLPSRKNHQTISNGLLKATKIFDSKDSLLKKIVFSYSYENSAIFYGAKFTGWITSNWISPNPALQFPVYYPIPQVLCSYYPIYDKIDYLFHKEEIDYTENGDSIINSQGFGYDRFNNLFHIREYGTKTYDNEKLIDKSYTRAGNFYDNGILAQQNWLTEIIETKQEVNLNFVESVRHEYKMLDNMIVKTKTYVNTENDITNCRKIYYDLYDSYNANLLQYSEIGQITSIVWGYNSQYPVAKIVSNKSFDEIKQLSQADTALLNNGTAAQIKAELQRIREVLKNQPNVLVSTYTYTPLIGMTSETGPTGRTTFYEYDGFGRLSIVKDENGNILKKICYNYLGQQTDCGGTSGTTYYNIVKSQSFTRNNCGAGYTGSSVIYTVPANTYSSTISQADADQKAQNDINNNGQNDANTNGTCTAVSSGPVTIVLKNMFMGTSFPIATVEFIQGGAVVMTKAFPSTKNGTVTYSNLVASGTYELRFTVSSSFLAYPLSYTMEPGGQMWDKPGGQTVVTTGPLTLSSGTTYTFTSSNAL